MLSYICLLKIINNYLVGGDLPSLQVEAVSTSVQDTSVLVQRSTLDLILFCFPFHMSQVGY